MSVKEFTQKILNYSFFNEEELASLLGVNQSLISLWKKGKRQIGSDNFLKLLDILGYSRLDYLIENPNPKVKLHFKASSLKNRDDLENIAKLNKLAANLSLMEDLLDNETTRNSAN